MLVMTIAIRQLQTFRLCVAIQTSLIPLHFTQQLTVTPEGCFTHLCVKIQIRKPLKLIDRFLLCYIKRAVRNTQ